MIFRQLLNEPIAAASYLIGCGANGVAAVVDPGLPAAEYALLAANKGLRIIAILETHMHADYFSTGRALAQLTGATIYAPRLAEVQFEHSALDDGDTVPIGNLAIQALHTPGHTPEHMAYLVTDTPRANQPWFVLSGDCLFVGDVGRADLVDLPLSGPEYLYDSLQKLLALPNDLELYPAHYGGSACGGKAMSGKVASTIGFEKRFNWALRAPDKATFIEWISGEPRLAVEAVLTHRNTNRGELPLPPEADAPVPLSAIPAAVALLPALTPAEAAALLPDALLIDLRTQLQFAENHPSGALNVAFNSDQLVKRVAAVTAPQQHLITLGDTPFVAKAGAELLAAAGRNQLIGYLDAPASEWAAAGLPSEAMPLATLDQLHQHAEHGDALILDVRDPFEWEKGVIAGARLVALADLRSQLGSIPRDQPLLTVCESGTRASAAASLLRQQGYQHVTNVAPDGMSEYARRFPTVKP